MDDFDRALQAALEGDIGLLLGDNADTWWSFVEERVMLGADQLMLRVDMEDESIGPWCIWVVLDVVDSDDLTLGQIFMPDYENHPDTAMAIPDRYEQVPYFVVG